MNCLMAPQHIRGARFAWFLHLLVLVPPFLSFIGFLLLLQTAFRVANMLFVEELWYLVNLIMEDVGGTKLR